MENRALTRQKGRAASIRGRWMGGELWCDGRMQRCSLDAVGQLAGGTLVEPLEALLLHQALKPNKRIRVDVRLRSVEISHTRTKVRTVGS
eukprot:3173719-Pleurochrysis_carterae.AAC.2